VFNETTDEPELMAIAARLLAAVCWHGPVQVEFVRAPHDGMPLLLEVNPRFWGSLDLAIAAGVDLPSLTCRLALGERLDEAAEGPEGVRFAWVLPYALLALREGRWRESSMGALTDPATGTEICVADWLPHTAHLARLAGRSAWRLLRGSRS
jgi:predicted ATP-grasp superfamily ATP-dependent carboligase